MGRDWEAMLSARVRAWEEGERLFRVEREETLAQLRATLPREVLRWQPEEVAVYECDGLPALRERPLAVALPRDTAEVQEVLRVCARLGVPVVARGAGTGLSGGALPCRDGVVLSLARLNRVLEVDPVRCWARVEAGVRNLAISEAAATFGLFYAPDPSSQVACTIGGNVAENAGGVHCLKYGVTVHHVLEVRGFTVDGEEVVLGSTAEEEPGFGLLPLVVGSEGMLAVVTEVTVRLLPTPPAVECVLAAFDSVRAAGEAVAAIIAAGIVPAGLEMMDRGSVAAVETFMPVGYPKDAAAVLLCEVDGRPEEVEEELPQVLDLLHTHGAREVRVARNAQERAQFWAGRKAAFPAAGRVSPDYYCVDGTIPRRALGEMLEAIAEMEQRYGLRCLNVFHAGDGNLHPLILFDGSREGEWERAEAFGAEILERSVALGGTITGEHGVGAEKINQMCVQFSREERAVFFGVRAAFDRDGRLNPGKMIPSLPRCVEYGRMRVRGGALPFANLPRF
ncbi:MAG: FAD-binding protein [Hydrogenophilus sp.]|nr:FAD-binding protein [Hydrogenophilus sp.]